MPTKPWKDLEGHYFRIDVGSTAAAAMQGDPYTIYYTTEGYIVLNGEMMGRTITDDSSPTQVIDLAALDPNTWYPVTCILPENLPTNVLTIKHNLWGWAGPIPPWASHSSGFYAFMRVTCNPSQWGANVEKSLVTHNSSLYVKGASPIFFKRTTTSNVTDRNQSCAIFYLRGGTTYHGSIQIGNDLEIEKQYLAPWAVHPDGFTDKGSKETYLPISDTSKLPANIPDVPARLDTLESTVKTKADASAVYDRATVDRLHQDVVKTSQLPEVYEQASLYGVLTVERTETLPAYAREVHVRQSGSMTLGISTDTASLSTSRGLYIYIEGHDGSVTLRTPAPVWFLNSDGAIAQSKRFKMTFGAACCLTYREGSFTLIPLSPVPITPL